MKKGKRDYLIFLEDILESAKRIEEYTQSFTKEKLLEDQKVQDAVIRRFEIIGEAVKKLPPGLKKNNKEIKWKEIAGIRDILIHEYFGVNMNRVWKTIEKDIPD